MHRRKRHAAWFAGWLPISMIGAFLPTQPELTLLRDRSETDTRLALQLFNQRTAQNGAVLSTPTLPRRASVTRANLRLPTCNT